MNKLIIKANIYVLLFIKIEHEIYMTMWGIINILDQTNYDRFNPLE